MFPICVFDCVSYLFVFPICVPYFVFALVTYSLLTSYTYLCYLFRICALVFVLPICVCVTYLCYLLIPREAARDALYVLLITTAPGRPRTVQYCILLLYGQCIPTYNVVCSERVSGSILCTSFSSVTSDTGVSEL